jgi:hypothetical protein
MPGIQWRSATVIAAALVAGAIVGPPLAQAAATATGLIRIEGGRTTHLAAVSKSGQLSVNAGLATTPTGQLQVAEASPADTVTVFAAHTPTICSAGGFYKIPAGKALIITSATFYDDAINVGMFHGLGLVAGPAAKPCTFDLAVAITPSSEDQVTQNQVFSPGIAVPAGDSLALNAANDRGTVFIYGYLVPASAVPHGILKHMRAPRDLVPIEPR